MKRPVISAWRERASGLLEPGWYATDDAVPRQGPCETKLEAENRVRELRGEEPRAAAAGGRKGSKAAALGAGVVRVPCKACSVCRVPFKPGEAVVR